MDYTMPADRQGGVSTNGDYGRQTAEWTMGGRLSTNGERINESRPQTADGRPRNGRWGQTVNEWGTNQRIKPQTADGRPRNGRW